MLAIKIFAIGVGVLLGTIVLNMVADKLGLVGWYQFLQKPAGTSIASYLWLFVVYPLGLGVLAYYLTQLIK